jgi:hypothetical protein
MGDGAVNAEWLSPRADLIRTVASRLRPDGKDYGRSWVIFPEKRPAYYLRKIIAETEKSGFIPPRIDSLDGFVDRVHAERLGSREKPIDALDAVALLFDIHRAAPDRLGGGHFLSADRFFPVGTKIFRDIEELALAGVRPEDLRKTDLLSAERVPPESRRGLQFLSFFYETFFEVLKREEFSTQATRTRDVLAAMTRGLFPDIDRFFVAGFFSLARLEKDLVKMLGAWDGCSLLLVRGKGIEDIAAELGIADGSGEAKAELGPGANPEDWAGGDAPAPLPELVFIKSPDTHGQIFALNKVLEDKLSDPKKLNERQVVVLPAAESLFPLYQQTLAVLSEDDYNISMGYPLGRTPIFTFFDKLLELLTSLDEDGRIYALHYLRFVLHPYTKNIYFPGEDKRADLTRILFHAIEDELTRRRMKAYWSLEELETDPAIWDEIKTRIEGVDDPPPLEALRDHLRTIHARLLAPFLRIANVGEFAEKSIGALDYIYETSTARQHYFFHPYAEAFAERLDGLARSELRGIVFEERASYFSLFRKVVAAGTVPFYGTPLRGLQVLGFWETRGLSFDDVYLLDMNEGTIPAYRRSDTLLPFAARMALGLPTYADYERRMAYYLDVLVRGAARVHVFFVENKDKERSRFVETLLWEKQKKEREPQAEKFLRTVQYRVALQSKAPDPVAKTPDVVEFLERFRYSATALDTYLACPLQFYYAQVLNLREKEQVQEDMERKDIGIFVHAILEDYYGKFAGRPLTEADLDVAEMGRVIDRHFERSYGRDLAGSAYLMRLQIRRHLEDFLTAYQAPILRALGGDGESLKILSLERKTQIDWEFGGRTFRLVAKTDRTEERGSKIFVLDYKTGSPSKTPAISFKKLDPAMRETWSAAIRSLQLPFYNLILARSLARPREEVRCRLVMLGKNVLDPKIEIPAYPGEDGPQQAEQIAAMEKVIGGLLTELVDPEVPFKPGDDPAKTCVRCLYTTLCDRKT